MSTHTIAPKPAQLQALKEFVAILRQNPAVLDQPSFHFFKEFLMEWGATIPAPKKPEVPKPEEEKKERHEEAPKPSTAPPPPPPVEQPAASAEKKAEQPAGKPVEKEQEESKMDVEEEDPSKKMEDPQIPFMENPPPEPEIEYPDTSATATDPERASELKGQAMEKMAEGAFDEALSLFSQALKLNPSSAILWGNRGQCLLKMRRPMSAIKDGDCAVKINPDSAKGYRVRGLGYAMIGQWEKAGENIHTALRIDYDPELFETLKPIDQKLAVMRAHEAHVRALENQRKAKEREAELKRRREEQERRKKEAEEEAKRREETGDDEGTAGEMPPGMAEVFKDPEVMAALKDPAFMANLQNPAKLASDPKFARVMEKLKKLGLGFASAPGGMGGGMGGMGGMGGVGESGSPDLD